MLRMMRVLLLLALAHSVVRAESNTQDMNDNLHLSTSGMIETVVINAFVFIILMMIFESNRFYKQIYLKRLQNRFRIADRVPPNPPEYTFGWFFEMQKISETELLRMVGLDAYMCLRFIVICYKLSLFLTFWGLLVLVPVYASAAEYEYWDRYSISNLLNGARGMRSRLWVSAFFGYMFAAYFCQLLYLEYNNFSVRRLQYLVQADPDGENLDPDTPAQTYFTVMVERIPSYLRSAEALYKFFDKIFPGEVFTVEIALDIAELDAMNAKRKRLRAKLEHAVAHWEAKNERPLVYARNPQYIYTDDQEGWFGTDSIWEFLKKQFNPEKFGYEQVDAIHYYTEKLQRYNREVTELQKKYSDSVANADEGLQRKFKSRQDTRVAAFVETIGSAALGLAGVKEQGGAEEKPVAEAPSKKSPGFRIESLLFGGGGTRVSLDTAFDRETERLEKIVAQEAQEAQRRLSRAAHEAEQSRRRSMTAHATVFSTKDEKVSQEVEEEKEAEEEQIQVHAMQARPFKYTTHEGKEESEESVEDVAVVGGRDEANNGRTGGGMDTSEEEQRRSPADGDLAISLLEQDHTLRQWIKSSNVDFQREELILSKKVSPRDPQDRSSHGPSGGDGLVSHQPTFLSSELTRRPSHYIKSRGTSVVSHRSHSRNPSRSASRESSSHGTPANTGAGLMVSLAKIFNTATETHSYNALPEEEDEERGLELRRTEERLHEFVEHGSEHREAEVGMARNRAQAALRTESFEEAVGEDAETGSHSSNPMHQHHQPQQRRSSGHKEVDLHHRTGTGGVSTVLPVNVLTNEQLNELTLLSIEKAKLATKQGWMQTRIASLGAIRGLLEIERAMEMVMLGAYYKYSSTAFVTFTSRVTESIAQQMLLSHDAMEVNHAPNPHDIIWDNVAIPKSQIIMRKYITNIGVVIGSIFWSSLVNDVNAFANFFPLPQSQQQLLSAVIMLIFLLILPFIFDYVARNYEGLKLESEIQNSIMTRYFYYQLINVYVTVGFSSNNLWKQILDVLSKPQTLVDIIGGRMPMMSKFFFNLLIVKLFTAIPLEMIRPWQLSTIHLMGNCMDRRKCTRRDLRTGAFYSWPMLYGWIYPQLMMVLMIMVTYAVITPLIMPLCALFFASAYAMYKYQLLYVYINEYQSGGFMWYAVFSRSVIALEFASCCLLGYLSLQLNDPDLAGPFFFLLPLPFCLFYFAKYCESKFRKASMNLSYGFARELDHRNQERKLAGKPIPHDTFTKHCYRQPSLTEGDVLPEPYRNDGNYDILRSRETGEKVVMADWSRANRKGSISINVHELIDEGEEDPIVLQDYFDSVVIPLSKIPDPMDNASNHLMDREIETRARR